MSSITKVWTITKPYRRDCISRVIHLLFCSFEKTIKSWVWEYPIVMTV